jgi:peptidoglycan glycosyltransferase
VADKIKALMIDVVRNGTGKAAAIKGVEVAGKTGSAENPHGQAHAWFVGFAPAEDPKIAVAVVVENAGSGGAVAGPIAREVILKYLSGMV